MAANSDPIDEDEASSANAGSGWRYRLTASRRMTASAIGTLVRRWRATKRLARVDAPTMWRLASHGAVVSLIGGVIVVTQLQARVSEASTTQPSVSLADRLGERARSFVPEPVLRTTEGEIANAVDPNVPEIGFVSPGVIAEADLTLLPYDEVQTYVVAEGDTVSEIAAQFGLEPEKLLYFNPSLRDDPHALTVGTELTILPIEGVVHLVGAEDTLQSIAEKYSVDVESIVAYEPNGLADVDGALEPERELVIPGGTLDVEIKPYYTQVTGVAVAGWAPTGDVGPNAGTGNFHVASYARYSRGFRWGHPAVDLSAPTGTPIYAIDSGTVERAGWLGWTGNAVALDHGNSYKSLYAHMNSIAVSTGQTVQRGQIIGTVGCTRGYGGYCTGPHLHLEVYYEGRAVDPCAVGACP